MKGIPGEGTKFQEAGKLCSDLASGEEKLADGPVSRIVWARLQTNKLFGINRL
jgi:hypothetical protein